jgi:hypothetical protein
MDQASLLEMCTLLFWPMMIFSISKDDHRGKRCSMKKDILKTIFNAGHFLKTGTITLTCGITSLHI